MKSFCCPPVIGIAVLHCAFCIADHFWAAGAGTTSPAHLAVLSILPKTAQLAALSQLPSQNGHRRHTIFQLSSTLLHYVAMSHLTSHVF